MRATRNNNNQQTRKITFRKNVSPATKPDGYAVSQAGILADMYDSKAPTQFIEVSEPLKAVYPNKRVLGWGGKNYFGFGKSSSIDGLREFNDPAEFTLDYDPKIHYMYRTHTLKEGLITLNNIPTAGCKLHPLAVAAQKRGAFDRQMKLRKPRTSRTSTMNNGSPHAPNLSMMLHLLLVDREETLNTAGQYARAYEINWSLLKFEATHVQYARLCMVILGSQFSEDATWYHWPSISYFKNLPKATQDNLKAVVTDGWVMSTRESALLHLAEAQNKNVIKVGGVMRIMTEDQYKSMFVGNKKIDKAVGVDQNGDEKEFGAADYAKLKKFKPAVVNNNNIII